MLDNLVNSLRRGVEQVRARGEEVTQAARLRLDIFQLNRELDGLYGRLGRAYHANADLEVLASVRGEISRVDSEIAAREQQIADLGQPVEGEVEGEATAEPASTAGRAPLPLPETASIRPEEPHLSENLLGTQGENKPDAPGVPSANLPNADVPSASSIFQAKRQEEQEDR